MLHVIHSLAEKRRRGRIFVKFGT